MRPELFISSQQPIDWTKKQVKPVFTHNPQLDKTQSGNLFVDILAPKLPRTADIQNERQQSMTPKAIKDIKIKQAYQQTAIPPLFMSPEDFKADKDGAIFADAGVGGTAKNVAKPVFTGFKDYTTVLLDKLASLGKHEVSEGHLASLVNEIAGKRGMKEAELKLYREAGFDSMKGGKANVQEFADNVHSKLLKLTDDGGVYAYETGRNRYREVNLPHEETDFDLGGNVRNGTYKEVIYETPIETPGAGHEGMKTGKYFAHHRHQDLIDGETRQFVEFQGDLMQGDKYENVIRLHAERAGKQANSGNSGQGLSVDDFAKKIDEAYQDAHHAKTLEMEPLMKYRNTWYQPVVRSAVKNAAKDGMKQAQVPTGRTVGKIEGFMGADQGGTFQVRIPLEGTPVSRGGQGIRNLRDAEVEDITNGMTFTRHGSDWVVVEDANASTGQFRAVDKKVFDGDNPHNGPDNYGFFPDNNFANRLNTKKITVDGKDWYFNPRTIESEAFSLADATSYESLAPEHKAVYDFYEDELGKFLKKNYNATIHTDAHGNTWWQFPIDQTLKDKPVNMHGKVDKEVLATVGAATGIGLLANEAIKGGDIEGAGQNMIGVGTRVGKKAFDLFQDAINPELHYERKTPEQKRKEAIIDGVDISSYATDPTHEQRVNKMTRQIAAVGLANEADINAYIKKRAPLSHVTGAMVKKAADMSGASVNLLLAILQNDSMFGTTGKGARTRNPGNYGNDDTGKLVHFKTWQDGVNAVAEWLSEHKIQDTAYAEEL